MWAQGLAPPDISVWMDSLMFLEKTQSGLKPKSLTVTFSVLQTLLCLLVISRLSTPPPCSPSVKLCLQFLTCSTLLHVSGTLYILFPLPQKLLSSSSSFWAQLKCSFLREAFLRLPPDLARPPDRNSLSFCTLQHLAQLYFNSYLCDCLFGVCLFYCKLQESRHLLVQSYLPNTVLDSTDTQ